MLTFIGGLGGGFAFPILPALGLRLGIPTLMVGMIMSANRITRLVCNVPAGHLIRRVGARFTLSAALWIETLGVFGYTGALRFGHPTWWLLIGRVVFGVGTALLLVGSQAAVLALSDKSARGRQISIVRVSMSISMPAGLVIGGLLADLYSDDVAFIAGSAITLAGALLALALLPRRTATPAEHSEGRKRERLTALLSAANWPFLVGAWAFNLLVFLSLQGILLSTMVVLIERRHLHPLGLRAQGASGLIMAVLIACSALIALQVGRLIDRTELRATLVIPGLIGLAAGFATIALVHSSVPLLIVGAALIGLSANCVNLPMLALLADGTSERQYGPSVGVYQFFGDVGGTIGPIAGIEIGVHYGFEPLFLAVAAVMLLGVPAAFWIRHRERLLNAAHPHGHRIDADIPSA